MDSRYGPITDAVLQAEVPGHVDNLRVEGGGDEEPGHQDVSVTLEAFITLISCSTCASHLIERLMRR